MIESLTMGPLFLTLQILLSPLVTADPRKWPRRMFGATITTARLMVTLPMRVRDEMVALRSLRDSGHVHNNHTFLWRYGGLAQLCVRAVAEAWRGSRAAYRAPAQLWIDTVRADDGHKHALQTVSLCGRKVGVYISVCVLK